MLHGFSAYGDNDSNDCNGHGTHVAGTVGGSTYGVAKNVTMYSGMGVLCCCFFTGAVYVLLLVVAGYE